MNIQDRARFETTDLARAAHAPGYMSGFGNSFESEALAGALPVGRNSPQHVPARHSPRHNGAINAPGSTVSGRA